MTALEGVDLTEEFVEYIKANFVGRKVDQPLTTYDDNVNKWGVGNKIKARGWAQITGLSESSGKLIRFELPDPIGNIYITEAFSMVFPFDSWTRGERWVYPGGALVDYVWKNLHPKGVLKVNLIYSKGEQGVLDLEITIIPGHDDRANDFIATRVAPGFQAVLDHLIESYTGVDVI